MNGKDIFIGLRYIDEDLIEEAEFHTFSAKPACRTIRRPLLVAAVIALTLLLVGCAVVYVMKMQDMKLGQQQKSYDAFDYDTLEYLGKETYTEQVFTVAGLQGTPAYQAAQEWFNFKQSYDPDYVIRGEVWGNEPEFPPEYQSYNIYTQEMKDKLDEITEKYGLKLAGGNLEFRTVKNMCQALNIERFQTVQNDVTISIDSGGARENGNFSLNLDIAFPEDTDGELTATWGVLRWSRKDCFTEDVITFEDTGDWKEWNYTTASGNEVLIIRSPSDWRGWIICDREEAILSLQVETRSDAGYNVDGKTWWEYQYLTDGQMEQIADAIDFGIQPRLVSQEDVDNQPDVPASATQNGYTLTLKSVETDGYVARILVGVTAPEGVDIESLDIGTGTAGDELIPPSGRVYGSGGFNDVPDGDGLANTKDLLLEANLHFADEEEDTATFAPGSTWNLHIENLVADKYDAAERILAEGEWLFPITFNETNSDYREIELLTEPVQADACIGWKMDGTDVLVEFTVTSFKLRKFSSSMQWDLIEYEGEKDFGGSADFYCWTGNFTYAVMKDGTKVQMLSGQHEAPIDLDQVSHIILADGTQIPVPGVEVAPAEAPALSAPEVNGLELLSQPMDYQSEAGYATGPDGIRVPLYETFHLTSITLSSSTLTIRGIGAFDGADVQIQLVMHDGSQVTLTGCAGAPYSEPMSVLAAENPIDCSQVAYVLFPNGTKLVVSQ